MTQLAKGPGQVGLARLQAAGLYLQLWGLCRLDEGFVWGQARVCREGLGWKVQVKWCGGALLDLGATWAVQERLDGREVQIHTVRVGLSQSICGRRGFLGVHLQSTVRQLSPSPLLPGLQRCHLPCRRAPVPSPCCGGQGPAPGDASY